MNLSDAHYLAQNHKRLKKSFISRKLGGNNITCNKDIYGVIIVYVNSEIKQKSKFIVIEL